MCVARNSLALAAAAAISFRRAFHSFRAALLTLASLVQADKKRKKPAAKVKKGAKEKGAKVKDDDKLRPARPSKALSGFNFFFKAESKRMKETGEKLTYGSFGPHMGAKWAGMGAAERAPFMDEAKKDSERYR